MASIKYLNEGRIERVCFCEMLFQKLFDCIQEYCRFHMCLQKGIENLTGSEDLFFLGYNEEEIGAIYVRIQAMIFPYDMCECGRRYEIPPLQKICDFAKNLNGIHYKEIMT